MAHAASLGVPRFPITRSETSTIAAPETTAVMNREMLPVIAAIRLTAKRKGRPEKAGGAPGDDVLTNLGLSIAGASDPSQRFEAEAFVPRYFSLGAAVAIDPRYVFADVQAAVQSLLLVSFGFDARDLGRSVTAAEVMALIHTVPGVVAVDLTELLPYSDDAPPANTVLDAVPAFGARFDVATKVRTPAELLLINPAGITLTEMAP